MKKIKFLCVVLIGLATALTTSCGGDDDNSNNNSGGAGDTLTVESSIENSLIGTWVMKEWRTDGVQLTYTYNTESNKKGRWTRSQSDGYTAWYEFNWSANYSEGKYWFHEYITNTSSNMVNDWGVQYKVGRQLDDDFTVSDGKLYLAGMVYTKQ